MPKGNGNRVRRLVVVESPAKARTIGRYLGRGFQVAASVGHVRDLPKKGLGVDVEKGFEPRYVTIRGKGKILTEIKRMARGADAVILATDPDREGEAIAFHVAEYLGFGKDKDSERFQRVEFREITRAAITRALDAPGPLDMRKVEAQQARRILDRLVGYQVSHLLWKPIRPGLSAGRVQTVALRLVCDREDERSAFRQEEYWSINAHLEKAGQGFAAKLQSIGGKKFRLGSESEAAAVVTDVTGLPFRAGEVKRRKRRKNPPPPFTTSTLQQEAAKRLRFSARRTMSSAQRLYEGVEIGSRGAVGLITYMRTDSTRVSAEAAGTARGWIRTAFGEPYLPPRARLWGGQQQAGAQEAHEAIRPTDPGLSPDRASRHLDDADARLYKLIWRRFVASQMQPAVYDTTTADFNLTGVSGRTYRFRAAGSVVRFDGFTRLYQEAREAGDRGTFADLEPLPDLSTGDTADLEKLKPEQHFTKPPPRFSEASLVRELEKRGIGRPSTYAQILSKIRDRKYVEMEKRRFVPTPLGDTVAKLLVRAFPDIFDPAFTSRLEGELDRVELGNQQWRQLLAEFYPQFSEQLKQVDANWEGIVAEILDAEGETCEKCAAPMRVKWNRFGRFLGCSAYPACRHTRPIDQARGQAEDRVLGSDPDTGADVYLKDGPYGPYVQLGDKPEGRRKRPPRSSLPKTRAPDSVDLEYALKLLSLPRTLGTDPATGKPVTAGLGRYGPYVERNRRYRSLADPELLFTVTLEEALALLAQEGRQGVLKELGDHPGSGSAVVVLRGRYGPYVTDGSVNASLPKGVDPKEVTLEAAVTLLRDKGKKPRRGRRGRRRSSTRAG